MKFSEEIVARILRILERTGSHDKAWQAVEIDETTYHRWRRKNTSFASQVNAALQRYAAIDDDAIIETFRASLLKAARGGEELVVSTETTILPDGSQITKTSQRKQVRPPAEWALRMMANAAGPLFAQGAKNPSGGVPETHLVITIPDNRRQAGAMLSEEAQAPLADPQEEDPDLG